MARKRSTLEEIVGKMRQVEVLVSQGKPVAETVRMTERLFMGQISIHCVLARWHNCSRRVSV